MERDRKGTETAGRGRADGEWWPEKAGREVSRGVAEVAEREGDLAHVRGLMRRTNQSLAPSITWLNTALK